MCGIAGTYGEAAGTGWVSEALNRIHHRGPDDAGMATADDALHGHVRLAIQDPTPASRQPFRYGDVTLSYVGELWNAPELRRQLEAECLSFSTTGDTEVVAAAIAFWGMRAIPRLEGMFALAWTDSTGTYLARDRWGKVPLYWTPIGTGRLLGGVSWASERKAWDAGQDAVAALPPATVADLRSGQLWTYYQLPPLPPGREKAGERVRRALEEGVDRRLVADVPLCCLISGGMDSAAILELTRRRQPDVVAYHAYLDPRSPDRDAAQRLCDELDVELREVAVAPPDINAIRDAVWAIEVPMKAQVEIALLCLPLARRIRADGFRVVLSGEAADEVFGGYGNLARKAGDDLSWRNARRAAVGKMARGNFLRVNKVFMAHGVEARLPFMERELVEFALNLGVSECPPNKRLLREALAGLVPGWVLARRKETFQGAAGTIEACARIHPSPVRLYNQIARDLFGVLPHD